MTATQGSGRPKTGYYLADKTRVPSVTTITGRFKDSGGLIHWAWTEGAEGRDYRESRDKAAEAGSICHGWIENFIHGAANSFSAPTDEDQELYWQARQGFDAFLDWSNQVDLEILETEVPLVSEQYRYGGTFDALALIAGKPKLLDWKTSGGTYPDYVAQIAAYRQLLRERDGDVAPDSAQLLRIGKTHADFHLHAYPASVLDIAWDWFLRARELYDLDKGLKKVAA